MRKVFYPVARLGEIAPGEGKLVAVGDDRDCALFHTADGRYFAATSLCPHQNEPLDRGCLEGCEVVCRRHHLRFNLATGDCTNAGGFWLKTYEVRIDGDDVLIGDWEDD
jgi:nitrite reductase/ring-hydroxylating ferredoxin subunit